MTRILYLNPNATEAMTEAMVEAARAAVPGHEVIGWTNHDGPPAIQGAADGEAAVPGLLARLPAAAAAGAEAIVIGCFDDTGLDRLRAAAHCPVIGIGQAAFHTAALLGRRFSVVTTLQVSVPVIEDNIAAYGLSSVCAKVHASGIPVLDLEPAGPATIERLAGALAAAEAADAPAALVLGCAGMAPLRDLLQPRFRARLVDGVAAAARLSVALAP
ncbi:aspartate/glutamate racemase family protein [Frigidibacter sp. MR17.14]|uniref:aspartate/glutamate racemase family protein n=1 Tax=Frigidibacter sp. MR17.14 TaxID=3126509 RepID=UPI003012BD79